MTLTLQYVSDRLEIEETLARYAHAVDLGRWHHFDTIFTDDAVIDGIAIGLPREFTPAEFRGFVSESRPADANLTTHYLGNATYTIEGDTARAFTEFYTASVQPIAGEDAIGLARTTGGFYRDELVRTSDGWRIRVRRILIRNAGTRQVPVTDVERTPALVAAGKAYLRQNG